MKIIPIQSRALLIVLAIAAILAGCAQQEKPAAYRTTDPSPASPTLAQGSADPLRKYIALRHSIAVEVPEDQMTSVLQSVQQFCVEIQCEIIRSSIQKKVAYSRPSGSFTARIPPEKFNSFFDFLSKNGAIVRQSSESVDKTSSVIDTEAKIKNTTELRDRLRAMVGSTPASIKDLVEVERELSRAQSELDSLTAQRKVLANETEKIFVEVTFEPSRSAMETGAFAPIVSALKDAGEVFAGSIGMLITFLMAILPWLILILPTLWLLTRWLGKIFRKYRKS